MKYDKIYRRLKEQYSDEEIVDSMLIPEELTKKDKAILAEEMKVIRQQKLNETTPEEQVLADVMRMRFQIAHYLKREKFSFEKTFGKFLEEYIRIIRKSRRDFASDLAVHYTKLSRIINDREEPSIELCYRLEKHSAELLKAELWWNLIVKKQGFILVKDEQTKQKEQLKVKNALRA